MLLILISSFILALFPPVYPLENNNKLLPLFPSTSPEMSGKMNGSEQSPEDVAKEIGLHRLTIKIANFLLDNVKSDSSAEGQEENEFIQVPLLDNVPQYSVDPPSPICACRIGHRNFGPLSCSALLFLICSTFILLIWLAMFALWLFYRLYKDGRLFGGYGKKEQNGYKSVSLLTIESEIEKI